MKENERKAVSAKEEVQEWLFNNLEITEEDIEQNAEMSAALPSLVSAYRNKRLELGEKIIYTLRFPLGDIKALTVERRIKLSNVPKVSSKADPATQALKILEQRTGTPAAVLMDLDLYDFNRLASILSFFV